MIDLNVNGVILLQCGEDMIQDVDTGNSEPGDRGQQMGEKYQQVLHGGAGWGCQLLITSPPSS